MLYFIRVVTDGERERESMCVSDYGGGKNMACFP